MSNSTAGTLAHARLAAEGARLPAVAGSLSARRTWERVPLCGGISLGQCM